MIWPPDDALEYLASATALKQLRMIRATLDRLRPSQINEDVVQEAILKTLTRLIKGITCLEQFPKEHNFWLYVERTSLGCSIDEWRKTRRFHESEVQAAAEQSTPSYVGVRIEATDYLDWLSTLLDEEKDQLLFSLLREGKSPDEIRSRFSAVSNKELSAGALRIKRSRLYKKLRGIVAKSLRLRGDRF